MKHNKRMLLIEPVFVLQTAMRAGMKQLGWTVDTATDASSGLEQALTTHFDLILVEISQEDKMDGFSLIEKIKQQTTINKTTPLCTITVHDIPENRARAFKLGVDAFFEGVFLNNVVKEIDAFIINRKQLSSGESDD
jgi:CheY-like chemotaxis protein